MCKWGRQLLIVGKLELIEIGLVRSWPSQFILIDQLA